MTQLSPAIGRPDRRWRMRSRPELLSELQRTIADVCGTTSLLEDPVSPSSSNRRCSTSRDTHLPSVKACTLPVHPCLFRSPDFGSRSRCEESEWVMRRHLPTCTAKGTAREQAPRRRILPAGNRQRTPSSETTILIWRPSVLGRCATRADAFHVKHDEAGNWTFKGTGAQTQKHIPESQNPNPKRPTTSHSGRTIWGILLATHANPQ
ncbi:hypothetical protein QFZ30_004171 [Arthrobacter pascens]|nr:hypothetical protein [Arthrobacter pascens]